MSIVGDLISLSVSLVQEVGVILGVGALTITLVAHLLALHSHRDELTHAYVRAAHVFRAVALILIIVSGGAAILVHIESNTAATLASPAFLFKWALIALLAAFYFLERSASGYWQDAVEGFEGANWYALLIVHTMAPAVSWMLILGIYGGWLAAFGVVWAGFVWFMRHQSTIKPAAAAVAPTPKAAMPAPVVAPKLAPAPIAALAPKPPAPVVAAAPELQQKIEIHPNHSLLPMVAELDLPAPKKAEVSAPKAQILSEPLLATPLVPQKPEPVPAPPPKPAPAVAMTDLDAGLPGIRVMPKRPEDIEKSNRPASVNFEPER